MLGAISAESAVGSIRTNGADGTTGTKGVV